MAPLRTKWEVLDKRAEKYMKIAERFLLLSIEILEQMQAMDRTRFGEACPGCDEVLETEADFAQHFLIPNETYLNLGRCPVVFAKEQEEKNK